MKSLSQHIIESFEMNESINELRPIDMKNVDVNRAGYIHGQLRFDKKLGWIVFYNDQNDFSHAIDTYVKLSKNSLSWAEKNKSELLKGIGFGFKLDKYGDAYIEPYNLNESFSVNESDRLTQLRNNWVDVSKMRTSGAKIKAGKQVENSYVEYAQSLSDVELLKLVKVSSPVEKIFFGAIVITRAQEKLRDDESKNRSGATVNVQTLDHAVEILQGKIK